MEYLKKEEIRFSKLSGADEVGSLFFWKDRLFRAIHREHAKKIKALFSSGLIDELVNNNLFPKSWITNYGLQGYGLVVEHERIHPITYPREWSFSMLKDAAITVLEVSSIARKYGYQTKDANVNNIVFSGTNPLFVDLGSFVSVDSESRGWLAYEGFLQNYYYPMRIWQDGNAYIARRLLVGSEVDVMPHESYLLYRSPALRAIKNDIIIRIVKLYFGYRGISLRSEDQIKRRLPGLAGRLIFRLRNNKVLPWQAFDFQSWINKIAKINKKEYRTTWGKYQKEYEEAYRRGIIDPRFGRIIELIEKYSINSVLELAGNRGVFAQMILDKTNVKQVICIDRDENAVDSMYLSFKNTGHPLTPAIVDFLVPMVSLVEEPLTERFASDAVIALAVTHHLILTQHFALDYILDTIANYARKYVITEFMPMGLYDGSSKPRVPSWYTLEWFRETFQRYCRVLEEEQLDENRILFFGELVNRTKDCADKWVAKSF